VRIVVTGSLAYDYIMDFPGYFKDHVLPEKTHMLSVSFLVDSMRKLRGGVAGNVAYNLTLLGERPLIAATVGHDFAEYRAWLTNQGVDTCGLVEIEHEFTSSCFINTDRANNQIVAFYAGAMAYARQVSLVDLGIGPHDLVLISPTDPAAMERYVRDCQRLGVPYIFDPGKQTPRLEADHIWLGLSSARVFVGNDYEFAMMAKKLQISEAELIASTPITVITRGEHGSTIYTSATNGQGIDIPPATPDEVRDPTGAGDAYLAGLAFGLAHNFPLEVTGRIAAMIAVYAIEKQGCQEHTFTLPEFTARYAATFGAHPLVEDMAVSYDEGEKVRNEQTLRY